MTAFTPRQQAGAVSDRDKDKRVLAGKMVLSSGVPVAPKAKAPPSSSSLGGGGIAGMPSQPLQAKGGHGGAPVTLARNSTGSASRPDAATSNAAPRRNPVEADDDGDDDADFRDLRRQVKAGGQVSARNSNDLTLASQSQSAVRAQPSNGGAGVDPCYFDYGAAYRRNRAASKSTDGTVDPGNEFAEMMQFLKGYGLKGPLQSYSRALALQGIKDPIELVTADETRLNLLVTRAEFESADELILLDALRAFR